MANAADSAGKTSGGVAVWVRRVIALGHGRIVIARIDTCCGAACVARVPVALCERGSGHSEAQKRTQCDHGCLLFHVISPALLGGPWICRCHPTSRNACSALLQFTHFCANPCDLRLILFRPTGHAFHAQHHLKSHGNIDRIGTAGPRVQIARRDQGFRSSRRSRMAHASSAARGLGIGTSGYAAHSVRDYIH
jgi:hypothetical protein